MKPLIFECEQLENTRDLARRLAREGLAGCFLALCGDLGSGKTTFTRFLTEALGCATLATSPTFSLFREYEGGKIPVFHADLYRLGSVEELDDLGWEETLERFADGVVLVEWAEKFPECLPEQYLTIRFEYGREEENRKIELSPTGERARAVLEGLRK